MFRKAYSKEKPLAFENIGKGVYVIRQNITKIQNGDDVSYSFEENIVTKDAADIMECADKKEIKREAAIIDEYTLQLIDEGVL